VKLTFPIILASVSVLLNIIQFFVGLRKDRRLKRHDEFEYGAHLQIIEQKVGVSSRSGEPFFSYSGRMENCGSKPIQIRGVSLEYRPKGEPVECFSFPVGREYYLKAGEQKEISKAVSTRDLAEAKNKYGWEDCSFSLRIIYVAASGVAKEHVLPLAIDGPMGFQFAPRKQIIAYRR
jgi:hypothetical protein